MSKLLLKGGTVLIHDEADKVSSVKKDILIIGDSISEIDTSIAASAEHKVIDCTDKIISPGFVDTHHHLWESALKGTVEDLTAVPYFATMFTASSVLTPTDIFWAQLSGCMEAIDAGTTTVLDFAHANWTEDHGKQALAGSVTSGIRTLFALSPTVTLKSTAPELEVGELLPSWFMRSLEQLVKQTNSVTSRVRMAAGFDFYFMPKDVVVGFFDKVRSIGVDTVTSHWAKTKTWQGPGLPHMLKSYGLLDRRIVLSHMGGMTAEDAGLLREANTFIAASPSTEMTMGLGPPACFRSDLNVDAICSIGIDCHCATSGSMVNEVRLGLMAARGPHGSGKLGHGSFSVCGTAHDAYNMITIQGARALNMESQVGSIAVGKKADLVVFNAQSPAMCPVSDPVTAIIMHSGIGDIETVIIDGEVRKSDGRLLPVQGTTWSHQKLAEEQETITWRDLVDKLQDMQGRFLKNLSNFDMKQLQTFVENMYGM